MELINPDVDRYLDELVKSEHPVLIEMKALAEERDFPAVGPQVGRLLHTLAVATGAKRVVELGSGFGYSAFFFASAVGDRGRVVLTEYDDEQATQAKMFLERAGLSERVDVRAGDGFLIAEELVKAGEQFDIVFNDSDKEEYPKAIDVARRLLRPGGLLVCDNMLWYGRVLEPDPDDKDTAGILELTRQLYAAKDFSTTLIPMRDGLTVSVYQP